MKFNDVLHFAVVFLSTRQCEDPVSVHKQNEDPLSKTLLMVENAVLKRAVLNISLRQTWSKENL